MKPPALSSPRTISNTPIQAWLRGVDLAHDLPLTLLLKAAKRTWKMIDKTPVARNTIAKIRFAQSPTATSYRR
jgi:hypothetical protein